MRAKERTKVDQQETKERSLVKNKRTNQKCGQEKMVFGGRKQNKERQASAFPKVVTAIGKVDFAIAHLERVQVVNFANTKARRRILKERVREMPVHRQDFQFLKIPLKRDMILSGNKAFGIPIVPMIPQRMGGATQDLQLGWRQCP